MRWRDGPQRVPSAPLVMVTMVNEPGVLYWWGRSTEGGGTVGTTRTVRGLKSPHSTIRVPFGGSATYDTVLVAVLEPLPLTSEPVAFMVPGAGTRTAAKGSPRPWEPSGRFSTGRPSTAPTRM